MTSIPTSQRLVDYLAEELVEATLTLLRCSTPPKTPTKPAEDYC